MVPTDIVGKTGRALTEVGASGRVEIDGRAYEAVAVRGPVPAGDVVEVTGWRLVGEARYVLSVRRPQDSAPPPLARAEARGSPRAPSQPSAPTAPRCYACATPATTRCQSCGTPTCVAHIQSVYAVRSGVGASELLCEGCRAAAESGKVFWYLLGPGMFILYVLFLFVTCPRR